MGAPGRRGDHLLPQEGSAGEAPVGPYLATVAGAASQSGMTMGSIVCSSVSLPSVRSTIGSSGLASRRLRTAVRPVALRLVETEMIDTASGFLASPDPGHAGRLGSATRAHEDPGTAARKAIVSWCSRIAIGGKAAASVSGSRKASAPARRLLIRPPAIASRGRAMNCGKLPLHPDQIGRLTGTGSSPPAA